ncbi:MAG: proteolytic complex protein LbcA [Methylomicrobium sp.]
MDELEQSSQQGPENRKTAVATPKTAIDPDIMYMLLAAEIAGQRGQYDVALEGYLEAAKRVNDVRLAERAAKIALYIKDREKGDEAVALWLKQDADNLTARKIALLSALRKESKPDAIEHALFLLDMDPDGFEDAVIELIRALGQKGNIAFVYDVLEDLTERRSDQASVYFIQAMLAMQLNSDVLAERKIDKAIELQPDWEKALLFRAQIAAFSGNLEKARAYLTELTDSYRNSVKVKKMLAQVLVKLSEFDEAARVYREIVDDDPEDLDSKFSLALVHLQLEHDDKASVFFKDLLASPEWADQASFYLGRIAVRDGRNDEALTWFDKVSRGSLRFDAAAAAISLLLKDKKFDEASDRLRALKPRTDDERLRLVLLKAELHNEQKEYFEAFDVLSKALEEMPDQKELLYTRALIAERIDKLDVLEQDLRKILEKYPDDVSALNALGYTLVDRTDRYQEAQVFLEKALSLQPDEAVIIDSYGWLQFKLGNYQKALEYLQRAYSKQQENEIAAHLAEVLWVLGRQEEARKLFEQTIKVSPDDEYLLDFKRRILDAE